MKYFHWLQQRLRRIRVSRTPLPYPNMHNSILTLFLRLRGLWLNVSELARWYWRGGSGPILILNTGFLCRRYSHGTTRLYIIANRRPYGSGSSASTSTSRSRRHDRCQATGVLDDGRLSSLFWVLWLTTGSRRGSELRHNIYSLGTQSKAVNVQFATW